MYNYPPSFPHPPTYHPVTSQPSTSSQLDRNLMYGGNTILRNGSNSYRPLPVP